MRKVIQYYGLFQFGILVFKYFVLKKVLTVPGIRNKIFIRSHSSDKEVFKKIFLKLEYSFSQMGHVEYIIDAGAYTGLTALYFKKTFPESKVLCVEASPANFLMLKRNIDKSDITALNRALWNESTWLNFMESHSKQFGSKVGDVEGVNSIRVQSITVDSLLKENGFPYIDLLKIDIEGSEKELFESGYLSWLVKTKYIIIELHDRFKPGCAKSFFNALDSINYSLHLKGENILIVNHDFAPTIK